MVPEGSCEELDKRNAESHNVTIVEAKKLHGFQNPNDWLYFLPKGLTTDIVIGVGERLCKMAQIFKKFHHCKIFLLVVILLKKPSLEMQN